MKKHWATASQVRLMRCLSNECDSSALRRNTLPGNFHEFDAQLLAFDETLRLLGQPMVVALAARTWALCSAEDATPSPSAVALPHAMLYLPPPPPPPRPLFFPCNPSRPKAEKVIEIRT
eukprot:2925336-Pleurochrysis_carterae.AAC.1